MLFEGEIGLDEFFERFGGQKQHGICTPRNKPYIYLIYSPDSDYRSYGNLDGFRIDNVNEAPMHLRYAFEGNGEENRGNAAVLNHAGGEDGVYKSLLVFYLRGKRISQLGEYKICDIDVETQKKYNDPRYREERAQKYGLDEDGNKYFYLEKVTDLDTVEVKLVVSKDRDNIFEAEILSTRAEYNFLDPNIGDNTVLISGEYHEYEFLDRNNQTINITDNTDEARKVQQYLNIIQGIHNELKLNNKIKTVDEKTGKSTTIEYEPVLSPKFEPEEVKFYLVNVGWGLCQILTFKAGEKQEVWVMDCGGSGNNKNLGINFHKNLKRCLKDIYGFSKKKYRIDKLFISHPHDDHYNKNNYFEVDNNTEVWINPNVRFCTSTYIKFLNAVIASRCKVVEPIVRKGMMGAIKILHPDGHITLSATGGSCIYRSPIRYATLTRRVLYDVVVTRDNINELSPIIQIETMGKTIIVTGDAMLRSWEYYIRTASVLEPNCYVHSHHGTNTGYEINIASPTLGNIDDEDDLFIAKDYEFVSLINGYVHGGTTWGINATLAAKTELKRTDNVIGLKYYVYDVGSGKLDSVI
ncbi:ComEC/Rec2 family competence protein [Butyrivibrio hungatei]|uniref:Metallo-beta-lactamase domain-containing protein n=1 Tax=Butyrivibrio hungatei TaxID=185008 RepID=A0A1D9NY81_9FIRM|nr:hypothetical protein [Butyrivibrio hungatei]AOZ95348.1 hypothetical protein bhn_I0314 [Butyrivibrio hungatei]